MAGRIIAMLPLSGEVWAKEPAEPPTLEFAQAFIGEGGMVQVVEILVDGEVCQMLINENAKVYGMPINERASVLWIIEQMRMAGRKLSIEEVDAINGPALILSGNAKWT